MKQIIICTDCGGMATVTGDPDDYRVLCNHCDPRGPIIKRVTGHPEDVEGSEG
ncbi:hypothetical protein LCGC14_0386550 [marine sediment metagenome]|uniref:Uncharacterized protein n=1 Tax=marine sediment metagenome TaxID=412755 RepID=A0A0F9VN58_9ZZZZ